MNSGRRFYGGKYLWRIVSRNHLGESHGLALGVVIDGCPSGMDLIEGDIQQALDRRKPSKGTVSTSRAEKDRVEILSGVFQGKTTGTPISLVIRNADAQSASYDDLKDIFRPGHGDYTYHKKYGIRDWRGGGRSSGRETVARVAAGAVAEKVINTAGMEVIAYTKSIGGIEMNSANLWSGEDFKRKFAKTPCIVLIIQLRERWKICWPMSAGQGIPSVVWSKSSCGAVRQDWANRCLTGWTPIWRKAS